MILVFAIVILAWADQFVPATYTETGNAIHFAYDSGNGTQPPPASFAMTSMARFASGASLSWTELAPIPASMSFPTGSSGGAHWWHTGGDCGIGTPALKSTNERIPFGSPARGYVGVQGWAHGAGEARVELRTGGKPSRTFALEEKHRANGGMSSPFIVSDDRRVLVGYKVWRNGSDSDTVIWYRIYDLAPTEWAESFSGGVSGPLDGCGGGLFALAHSFYGRSSVGIAGTSALATDPVLRSPLRVFGASVSALFLVTPEHPMASRLRIQTPNGVWSVRRWEP